MRVLPALIVLLIATSAGGQDDRRPTLSAAHELRVLPAAEAARRYPVRLQAVVTLVEQGRTVFLRDETGASFIRWSKAVPPQLRTGQRIEVVGESYEGLYLTGISAQRITVLGEGSLPAPLPVNFEQLHSGQFHYERVEVRGIVRAVRAASDHTIITLALGDGRLDLHLPAGEPADLFIDAEVRVVGLAAGAINDRRQLVAPQLRIRSLDDVAVIVSPPTEWFSNPLPAAELLRFAPDGRAGHRVTVRGVVTHQEVGANVWLRDGTQGLRVRTTENDPLIPGDVVDVAGFPAMGTLSAELEDANYRRTGESAGLAAIPVSAKDLLTGRHDADLVEIEAEVRDAVREPDRLTLTVQAGDLIFPARLLPCPTEYPAPGARVRLTGICRVIETTPPTLGYSARVRSVELLLRKGATDLVLLRRPPWWTAARLAIAAGALLTLAMLAAAWAVLLRRRVAQQTAIIGGKLQTEAALEERARIAREFHDTLEQELVGLALRLDAAATQIAEPKPRELLAAARRLVQNIQTEARSLVRNLRARVLDETPLPEAIRRALGGLGDGRVIEVRTEGEAQRIPALLEHELLRIAQEATTNAVKHGAAHRIEIVLHFAPDEVQLAITDDGCGFDPEHAGAKPGHFGLVGIRERMQKMGGHATIRSQPGQGATVAVAVPIPPKAP